MVYYYILNFHGDVEQLWNVNGMRKALYKYDAFGNEKDLNENDENPFRYCGEYFDVETETVYLRARDYRAYTGRFTRQDPINAGLNWYIYANNNPILFADPSGLDAIILVNPNSAESKISFNGEESIKTGIKFGHMGVLVKNNNDQWYYFSCGEDYVFFGEVEDHAYLSDLELFSEKFYRGYGEVGPYTESVYIKGDFTKSLQHYSDYNAKNMETSNVNSYDALNNNCQTVVMEGVEQGTIADGTNVKDFRLENLGRGYYSPIPTDQIKYLQDSFFNNAFTYDEYIRQLDIKLQEFNYSPYLWKRSKFKAKLVERLK